MTTINPRFQAKTGFVGKKYQSPPIATVVDIQDEQFCAKINFAPPRPASCHLAWMEGHAGRLPDTTASLLLRFILADRRAHPRLRSCARTPRRGLPPSSAVQNQIESRLIALLPPVSPPPAAKRGENEWLRASVWFANRTPRGQAPRWPRCATSKLARRVRFRLGRAESSTPSPSPSTQVDGVESKVRLEPGTNDQ